MKRNWQLVFFVAIALLVGISSYKYNRSADKMLRKDLSQQCVERGEARVQTNKRMAAQRKFITAYESLLANQVAHGKITSRQTARDDYALLQTAEIFRAQSSDLPPLSCQKEL